MHWRLTDWPSLSHPAVSVALVLAGLTAFGDAAEPTRAIVPDRRIKLFDGETLGDCYTWLNDSQRDDPRKVFQVNDGLLHVTGDGFGSIITNKRYRDYHLVLEYKWGERAWRERQSAARDSGLLVHSNGVDGGYEGMWVAGSANH
jgi:hypothetical protein